HHVVQLGKRYQAFELMIAVGAATQHFERQIDFRVRALTNHRRAWRDAAAITARTGTRDCPRCASWPGPDLASACSVLTDARRPPRAGPAPACAGSFQPPPAPA